MLRSRGDNLTVKWYFIYLKRPGSTFAGKISAYEVCREVDGKRHFVLCCLSG